MQIGEVYLVVGFQQREREGVGGLVGGLIETWRVGGGGEFGDITAFEGCEVF